MRMIICNICYLLINLNIVNIRFKYVRFHFCDTLKEKEWSMIADTEKFGLLWTTRDAKTNTLYTIKDDSLYNSCKMWFMLVQDRNNKTQYLAFHNTSKIKDQIVTHIRTSRYSQKQKLYEIDTISLNKNPNIPEQSKRDYDTIFDDKNLYAIPEQYIDIIGNIDPNMVKYVEKFKEGNKLKQSDSFLLSVTADKVESTDEGFTMDNLSLGDNFKPINVYFQAADGNTVSRNRIKGEKKISNQTMPRIAFQIFEKQISNLSLDDKENFPICKYSLNSDTICGIYSSVEEFRMHRKTLEYMQYKYDDDKQFVIYCWNIFSTIIFIQECLKRFGNKDDKFVLSYIKKDKNEIESEKTESLKQEYIYMNNNQNKNNDMIPLNQILYGPPGTGKTYNTVVKAMEIIGSKKINMKDDKGCFRTNYSESEYKFLKEEFDELRKQGQIEFVTFHQSYSYEEFIEGIKPYIPEWGSVEERNRFIGEDGIFKTISKNALFDKLINNNYNDNKDFYKIIEQFKNEYPVGSVLKTQESSNFEIVNYTGTSIRIEPMTEKRSTLSISYQPLEEMYNISKKMQIDTRRKLENAMNNRFKGLSSYYLPILNIIRKFNVDNKKIYINKEYKEKLIKEFYKNKIVLNNKENNKKYILIIDEINRGDVSKIFGELITLIEEDKRIGNKYQMKSTLPYSKEQFGVPNNLYIIGTMNTADRSIALLDTALRRRFDFEEIMPRPELLDGKVVEGINLQTLLKRINERITNKYDRDHQIGHSYLMSVNTKEQLERAYKNRILPLLNEYFYNESKSVAEILNCSESELKTGDFVPILSKAQVV